MNKEIGYSYTILSEVYFNGQYASIGLNKLLSTVKGDVNTKIITKLVYGVIEKDISLEYILKQFVTKLPSKHALLILKMGIYMHFFLSSIPDYTIVNELVNLVKSSPEKHLSGFVNGTLKNIFKGKVMLPKKEEDLVTYLSIKYGYPTWLVEELLLQSEGVEVEKLLATKLTTDTHIRVKEKEKFLPLLDKENIRYTQSMDEHTYYVDYFALLKHPEWKNYYVVQGCPSIIVAKNMKECEHILDVCAAPGGKSVLLATLQPKAKIVACDLYEHRCLLINQFARSQHISNIETFIQDGTKTKEDFVGKFDGVLCDVPCSGVGVVGKKPDILLSRRPENIEELVEIQSSILKTSSQYVKKGGRIIYSTCSILKRENEDIVQEFLSSHKDFVLKKVNTYGIPVKEENAMVTFYPHISHTEGFFIAIMEKI